MKLLKFKLKTSFNINLHFVCMFFSVDMHKKLILEFINNKEQFCVYVANKQTVDYRDKHVI